MKKNKEIKERKATAKELEEFAKLNHLPFNERQSLYEEIVNLINESTGFDGRISAKNFKKELSTNIFPELEEI